jgi:biotin carboxyl carrier protein
MRKKILKVSVKRHKTEKEAEPKLKDNFVNFEIDGDKYRTTLSPKYLHKKPYSKSDPRQVLSFIPGTIQKIFVQVGDHVNIGDKLLILEAMKMKNILMATAEGTVKAIHAEVGVMVSNKQLLVEIE